MQRVDQQGVIGEFAVNHRANCASWCGNWVIFTLEVTLKVFLNGGGFRARFICLGCNHCRLQFNCGSLDGVRDDRRAAPFGGGCFPRFRRCFL